MEVGQRRRPAGILRVLVMEGRPTTIMPLQKEEKSWRPMSWAITITARFLERTVVGVGLVGSGMSRDGFVGDHSGLS